jgi:hypothetical protein
MKLHVRAGDLIIVGGEAHKVIKISELDFAEKQKRRIPPSKIARQLVLDNQAEIVFLNC